MSYFFDADFVKNKINHSSEILEETTENIEMFSNIWKLLVDGLQNDSVSLAAQTFWGIVNEPIRKRFKSPEKVLAIYLCALRNECHSTDISNLVYVSNKTKQQWYGNTGIFTLIKSYHDSDHLFVYQKNAPVLSYIYNKLNFTYHDNSISIPDSLYDNINKVHTVWIDTNVKQELPTFVNCHSLFFTKDLCNSKISSPFLVDKFPNVGSITAKDHDSAKDFYFILNTFTNAKELTLRTIDNLTLSKSMFNNDVIEKITIKNYGKQNVKIVKIDVDMFELKKLVFFEVVLSKANYHLINEKLNIQFEEHESKWVERRLNSYGDDPLLIRFYKIDNKWFAKTVYS